MPSYLTDRVSFTATVLLIAPSVLETCAPSASDLTHRPGDTLHSVTGIGAEEEREPMAIVEKDAEVPIPFEQDVAATQRYFDGPRFDGIIRLYTARQVVGNAARSPPTTPSHETRRRPSTLACANSSPRRRASPPSAPTRRGRP